MQGACVAVALRWAALRRATGRCFVLGLAGGGALFWLKRGCARANGLRWPASTLSFRMAQQVKSAARGHGHNAGHRKGEGDEQDGLRRR
jgi:hypothetical protein